MTSASQNVHRDKLDDTVNKYSNIYHSTIKMGPVDVKSSTYIKFGMENNDILQKVTFQIGLKNFL